MLFNANKLNLKASTLVGALLFTPVQACDFKEGLYDRLLRHEGYRECAYKDIFGNLTIGVGHLLRQPAHGDLCWTKTKVLAVFKRDVDTAIRAAQHDTMFWHNIPRHKQEVLIELAFQIGGSGLSHFTHMLAAVEKAEWETAADELLNSQYAKQVPRRANELACLLRGKENA